jgi:hypothetical protein
VTHATPACEVKMDAFEQFLQLSRRRFRSLHYEYTNVLPSRLSYTAYSQKNGAVSKVNKKSISHLTWIKRTPSAAATV